MSLPQRRCVTCFGFFIEFWIYFNSCFLLTVFAFFVSQLPKLFYARLPQNISKCRVLLLDPMLASGGSAICAVVYLVCICACVFTRSWVFIRNQINMIFLCVFHSGIWSSQECRNTKLLLSIWYLVLRVYPGYLQHIQN